MAQTLKLKRTSVANKVPTTSNIEVGELAFNTNDKALFIRGDNDAIVTLHDEDTLHIDRATNRVGIGTTSPGYALDVGNSVRFAGSASIVGTLQSYSGAFNVKNIAQDQDLNLQVNDGGTNTTALTVQGTTANVGIGTSSPDTKLHVEGNLKVQDGYINLRSSYPRIYLTDTGDNPDYQILNDNGVFSIYDGTNSVHRLRVASTGITFNNAYTFPTSDGTSNQVLVTDGSGNLSFADVSGSSGISVTNNVNNRVLTGDGTNANAEANLTFDGSTLDVTGNLIIDTNPAATYGVSEALRIDDIGGTADRQLQFFELSNSGARSHRLAFNTNITSTGSAYTHTQGNYGGSSQIEFGNSGAMIFYVNAQGTGGSTEAITPTERLRIESTGDVQFKNTSGTTAVSFQTGSNGHLKFIDSSRARFGNSNDMDIYHDGSNSYVRDMGTGELYIDTNSSVRLISDGSYANGKMAEFTKDGDVKLYYDNSQKLATTSSGVTVTGNLVADTIDVGGDLTLDADGGDVILKDGGTEFGRLSNVLGGLTLRSGSSSANAIIFSTTGDAIFGGDISASSGTISSGDITSSGRIKTTNGLFQADEDSQKFRQYHIESYDAGASFLLGQIENSGSTDGGVEGVVRFAYDFGSTTNNCAIHFNFAQRSGTARGTWWYEHDDQDGSADRVHVRLIDDGAGNMYVWVTCVDYAETFIEANWRHGANVADSGTLSSGTLTTGTTLFDTANDPTSEHHIGKLFAHDNVYIPDSNYLLIGDGEDLQLQHNGSHSYIRSNTGDLYIRNNADDKDILIQTDDGSGGTTTYMNFDGSNERIVVSKNVTHSDNVRSRFGGSNDFQIYHQSSDNTSRILNNTGDLYLSNTADDKDIIFQTDDGSGGVTPYLTLDGSTTEANFHRTTKVDDNFYLGVGEGPDLYLMHDGSNSHIRNNTGNLTIQNNQNDGDISFRSDDGSGGTTTYFYLDGGNTNINFDKNLYIKDNVRADFGNASDLRIVHNATNSFIENRTGDLKIIQYADDGDISFQSDDGSGGNTEYFRLDGSLTKTYFEQNVQFNDNVKIQFGAGADLSLSHNGTHSYIDNNQGSLYISSSNSVQIENSSGNDMITASSGGAVTLFYNAFSKLATKSDGVDITGELQADSLDIDGAGDISGNLVVGGNLTINGTTVTNSATNTTIEDALIELGSGNTGANANDLGLILERGTTGDNVFIGWDESTDKVAFATTTATGASTGALTLTDADIQVGSITASGIANITGGVTCGTINTGQGTTEVHLMNQNIRTTDSPTFAGLTVDDITINDSTISDNGDLTVDVGGDITLDADGGDIILKDNGVQFAKFTQLIGALAIGAGTGTDIPMMISSTKTLFFKDVQLGDDEKLIFGDGEFGNMQLFHDGTDSFIDDMAEGNLVLRTNGTSVKMMTGSENMVVATKDGSVDLYYNNSKKLETTSTGATVTGTLTAGDIIINTANTTISTTQPAIRKGGGGEMFLDAPGHIIVNIDTNNNNSDRVFAVRTNSSTSNLFSVNESGNITVSGTVDGRDIATDGSKLDGIESGATADQTQSEINALGITATGLSGTPNITVGTLNATEFAGHIEAGGHLDFNVGSNYGTTTTADRLWISQFNTGQSDVPATYVDIINLSSSSTHGIQIASRYGAVDDSFWIRSRSDNSSAPAGVGLQAWKRLYHQDFHPEADTLTTARTIAGTSFDGSANIDISYNNLTNKPTIPTNNNQLTNGAGYITSADGGNAATLDSLDSTQFLRSDANDTYTGILTFGNGGNRIHGHDGFPLVQVNSNRAYFGSTSRAVSTIATNSTTGLKANVSGTDYTVFHAGNSAQFTSALNTKLSGIATGADVTPSWVPSSDPGYLTSSSTQSKYVRSDTSDTMTGTLTIDSGTSMGLRIEHDTFGNALEIHREDANNAAAIKFSNNSGTSGILFAIHSETDLYWRKGTGTTNYRIWTEENDGAGSGLHADLLDGQHGSYYAAASSIPTNNNQLTNGAGYITSSGNTSGTAGGLSGTPNISVGTTTTTALDVNGNADISGTLTMSNSGAINILNMNNNNIIGVNRLAFNDPGPNEGLVWSNIKVYESPDDLTTNSAGNLQVEYSGTRRFTVNSTGVDVNGALTATTKSFDIEHPSKEGMRLRYGSLEGPENGVYVRGKSKEKVISLPDYWVDLVHEDSITVQLTAIGKGQDLYVEDIKDNKVYVNGENYFYYILAERKDVERFEVEYSE